MPVSTGNRYKGTLIVAGGFLKESGQAVLDAGSADLIAIGRPFISPPGSGRQTVQQLAAYRTRSRYVRSQVGNVEHRDRRLLFA
jgi:2,4-dienoyl-CoA reductase-like NADH-dependent reductase (Old Yellow Enzyme family)